MPWPFAKELSAVFASSPAEASSSASTRFAFKLFQELAAAETSKSSSRRRA